MNATHRNKRGYGTYGHYNNTNTIRNEKSDQNRSKHLRFIEYARSHTKLSKFEVITLLIYTLSTSRKDLAISPETKNIAKKGLPLITQALDKQKNTPIHDKFKMQDAINSVFQSLDQFSKATLEAGINELKKKVNESHQLKEKKKEEFKKELEKFKKVAVEHYEKIDKKEIFDTFNAVAKKVNENTEKALKDANKEMERFVKKYDKKK